MITPNQIQQATSELKPFDLGEFKIPNEIQEAEGESYVCICVRSKDNAAKTAKVHSARLCYAPVDKWQQMEVEVQGKRAMGMFGGRFQMVIILHNPTLPLVEESTTTVDKSGMFATTGRMSPKKQEQIDKLMEEGKGADDNGLNEIAKEVNVSFSIVKEYSQSH